MYEIIRKYAKVKKRDGYKGLKMGKIMIRRVENATFRFCMGNPHFRMFAILFYLCDVVCFGGNNDRECRKQVSLLS
jgi:hypothetical protein